SAPRATAASSASRRRWARWWAAAWSWSSWKGRRDALEKRVPFSRDPSSPHRRTCPSDPTGMPELRIGTSGWSYTHWRGGVFYPEGMGPKRWLPYYAGHFDTVEVNGTFYKD